MNEHRLVIVGGGVAGLDIATRLARRRSGNRQLSVTLIDRETAYIWKPMLHTIAAGTSEAGMQQTVFAAQALTHGFRYEFGEAIGINRREREIRLAALVVEGQEVVPERAVPYDTLVLAVGSKANDFGTPGVSEHCESIDSRSDAIAFNDRLRIELLKAVVAASPLTVAIVGGGATGVELAAELIQVAGVAERYGIAGASSHLKVVLIESDRRLLGPFPERVATAAQRKLKEIGVEVRTGTPVTGADEAGFILGDGQVLQAGLRVWAAGVKASPLLEQLTDMERTRNGQLVVGPTLAAPGDPNIYALGDCAAPRITGRDGPVPTTAQAASQQAAYLSRNLPALIAGRAAPSASYHDFGGLVSLGGFDAYGTLGRFGFFNGGFLRGRIAQLGHALLYRRYQVRLHGLWRGTLLWLVDTIGRRFRAGVRLT